MLSKYARSLGMKSKKELKLIAPKDAQWSDFEGKLFWKVEGDKVYCTAGTGDVWGPSHYTPDMLSKVYQVKLK